MRSRRSTPLPGYDYRWHGWYHVTMCTHSRVWLFGEVVDGEVCLSAAGGLVYSVIQAMHRHFPRLTIGALVIMPNHVDLILTLAGEEDDDPAASRGARSGETSIGTQRTHPLARIAMGRTPPPAGTDASPLRHHNH